MSRSFTVLKHDSYEVAIDESIRNTMEENTLLFDLTFGTNFTSGVVTSFNMEFCGLSIDDLKSMRDRIGEVIQQFE